MAEAAAAAAFEGNIRAIRTWDFDTVGGRVHQPVLNIVGSVTAPAVESGYRNGSRCLAD